jgi:hypothetical protein
MPILHISDGTTMVDLGAGLLQYAPETGADSQRHTITETCHSDFSGPNPATVLAQIDDLMRLLAQAHAYIIGGGSVPVYLEYQPDLSMPVERSLLVIEDWRTDCSIDVDDREALRSELAAYSVEVTVRWTRTEYRELAAEIEIPLLNSSIANKATGGVVVYNHDDATSGHDNYVEIAAADVDGELPVPMRLEITNTYATNKDLAVFVGLATYGAPATIPHILEAELGASGTVTVTDDATCSGTGGTGGIGQYAAITWTGSAEALIRKWSLTAAQVQACAGRYFRLLARFKTLPASGISIRAGMLLPSGTTPLAYSGLVNLNITDALQDLGMIRIPPWLPSESSIGAVDLGLYATKSGGGGLDLDFIALIPTDGYREIRAAVTGVAQNQVIVDDGIDDLVWLQASGGTKTGQLVSNGEPLLLQPNRLHRLYFMFLSDTSGAAEIARTHSIRAYYRPRRLTL